MTLGDKNHDDSGDPEASLTDSHGDAGEERPTRAKRDVARRLALIASLVPPALLLGAFFFLLIPSGLIIGYVALAIIFYTWWFWGLLALWALVLAARRRNMPALTFAILGLIEAIAIAVFVTWATS